MDSPYHPEWFSERNALLQRISELEEENRRLKKLHEYLKLRLGILEKVLSDTNNLLYPFPANCFGRVTQDLCRIYVGFMQDFM